jgi:hypothetical protein
MTHLHYLAFGRPFFKKHQRALLWLSNAPLVRRWFRRVLRINGDRSAVGDRAITRIEPHAITWALTRNVMQTEFRTHPKFARRLYYAFRPLWWAMHAWDSVVADRFVPKLSFGFATLTAYPDPGTGGPTGSATVERSTTAESIATIRAGAGTYVSSTDNPNNIAGFQTAVASSPNLRALDRGHFTFTTSGLGASVDISAAVLSIYGAGKNDDGTPVTPDINIYDATPAANFNFVTTDYGQFGSTAQCDTPITYSGWSTSGYNDFTLNATGRGNVSKTGVTKFGTRNANYDVANVAPTYSSNTGHFLQAYLAQETGTSKDPKLVVTYSLAKLLTEAVSVVDALVKLPARTLSQSVTLSDVLLKLPQRTLSQSLSIVDSILRTIQRALIESNTITDTNTNLRIVPKLASESLAVSDALVKQTARPLTESFSITDAIVRVASRVFSETVSVVDLVVKTVARSLADALTILEGFLRTVSRPLSETTPVTDNVNRVTGRSLSESVSISDLFGKVYGRILTETLTISESIRRFLNNLDVRFSRKFPSNPGSYSAKYEKKGPTYEKKYPDPQ